MRLEDDDLVLEDDEAPQDDGLALEPLPMTLDEAFEAEAFHATEPSTSGAVGPVNIPVAGGGGGEDGFGVARMGGGGSGDPMLTRMGLTDIETTGLMQVLPADFPLPALIKFVPNPEVKAALDKAVAYAKSIEVRGKGTEGLAAADLALGELNDRIKATTQEFADAARMADQLHKGITSRRAEWCAEAEETKRAIGRDMYAERERLEAAERERRRLEQAEADRKVREEARIRAEAAKAAEAPPKVIEQLQQAAETATAPPVPETRSSAASAMKGSTTVKTWKARIKGTPAEEDPNPAMEDLSAEQWKQIADLMRDVADGKAPRACFAIDWSYLNKRAGSDKSTMQITNIEAVLLGSVRAKGSRARR